MSHTAKLAGVARLYNYQKFNPDYLRDVLVNRRVHCSDPANLNDPWDCKPWFREDSLDDPATLEEFVRFVCSLQPQGKSMSQKEILEARTQLEQNPQLRREILEDTARKSFASIPRRWRIYCLTPQPDSILMWSHYAENHRGISLEFSAANQMFGSAEEVRYESSYPRWTPQACLTEGARVLLTKSDAWRYEQEFRIIAFGEEVDESLKEHPLAVKDGFLKFPPKALNAVIVGCNADYETIKSLVESTAPDVRVKRAIRSPAGYQIHISDGTSE